MLTVALQHLCHTNKQLVSVKRCLSSSRIDIPVHNNRRQQPRKRAPRRSWQQSHRFVDTLRMTIRGGEGGIGCLSNVKIFGNKTVQRPDGGHGGQGGSIIIVADPDQQELPHTPHAQASKGANGTSQNCLGRNGENFIVRVPCGVVVKRILNPQDEWDEVTKTITNFDAYGDSEEEVEEEKAGDVINDSDIRTIIDDDDDDQLEKEMQMLQQGLEIDVSPESSSSTQPPQTTALADRRSVVVADLDKPGAHVMVARGGMGGVGSMAFSRRNAHQRMPPPRVMVRRAQGAPGEVAHLELELKLIADIGLVGFPNAGKSSLLHAMSRASPEVAPYPFTTLHPILGTIEYRDAHKIQVADIPGLIDGASQGRGKGHDFLRHIERTKALCYMLDAAGTDQRDPEQDLVVLAQELEAYGNGSLLERRALVVANKLDLLDEEEYTNELLHTLQERAVELGIRLEGDVIGISAGVTGLGLAELSKAFRSIVAGSETDREFQMNEIERVG